MSKGPKRPVNFSIISMCLKKSCFLHTAAITQASSQTKHYNFFKGYMFSFTIFCTRLLRFELQMIFWDICLYFSAIFVHGASDAPKDLRKERPVYNHTPFPAHRNQYTSVIFFMRVYVLFFTICCTRLLRLEHQG